MEMENFFNDNVYVLFGILLYYLFNNERHKVVNSKIIVIYTTIIIFGLFKILSIPIMISIFLFLFFFQYEILIDDDYKHKLITSIYSKLIDSLYLLVFNYSFLCFMLLIYFISKIDINIFISLYNEKNSLINFISTLLFEYNSLVFNSVSALATFIYIILYISKNDVELKSFDEIMNELNNYSSFGNFKILNYNKREILTYIEDRSFFYRENSYNMISVRFIKYKLKQLIQKLLSKNKDRKNTTNNNKNIKYYIVKIYKYVLSLWRGHSTIEMQLFRSIAIKNGYEKVIPRKFAELIYSQLFFKGLKKYYEINYTTVSNNRYRNFIIECYLNNALIFLGKKRYTSYYELFKRKKVSDCDFLFYVLSLSSKLDKDDILTKGEIDFEKIKYKYAGLLRRFNISDDELSKTINWFNKKRKSK